MNRFFAPGDEFARIERMFSPDRFARDGRGLGDDAFLWDPASSSGKTGVVTSDASAEGVHYRLDWTSPARALRKALIANLSDINAMGGRSRHAFFNLGARRSWASPIYDALGAALRALEEEFGFRVSGGDTVTLPGSSFFSFTVMGEVEGRPLLRSACRPGHRVYVSGTLGGSAAGLERLAASGSGANFEGAAAELVAAHLDPRPPAELGPLLASLGRDVAAIDVSDGLSSELWHLARQSGHRLRVEGDRLPAHPALRGRAAAEIRAFALHGGEEYQLLFTGNFSDEELRSLRAITAVTDIGAVEEGEGVLLREDGEERVLEAKGYEHGKGGSR